MINGTNQEFRLGMASYNIGDHNLCTGHDCIMSGFILKELVLRKLECYVFLEYARKEIVMATHNLLFVTIQYRVIDNKGK